MNFQVPQFIEVEDKIFGPLTFKQFIYLAGGAGGAFLIYALMPGPLFVRIVLMAPVIILVLALGFYKVHGRPFIVALEAGLKYVLSRRLYLWRKRESKQATAAPTAAPAAAPLPRLAGSKLKDLAWSLDIKEQFK